MNLESLYLSTSSLVLNIMWTFFEPAQRTNLFGGGKHFYFIYFLLEFAFSYLSCITLVLRWAASPFAF